MPRKGRFSSHCVRGHPLTAENRWPGGRCKLCSKARRAEGKNTWPQTPNGKLSVRKSELKCRYGISLQEYEDLLVKQNKRCAICLVELDSSKKSLIPAVDHVHDETKRVRGLLCGRCNSAIGLFDENPTTLVRAIQYLKETQ